MILRYEFDLRVQGRYPLQPLSGNGCGGDLVTHTNPPLGAGEAQEKCNSCGMLEAGFEAEAHEEGVVDGAVAGGVDDVLEIGLDGEEGCELELVKELDGGLVVGVAGVFAQVDERDVDARGVVGA